MSPAKTQSKKRKHSEISKDQELSFKLSSSSPEKVGPILVSYPALQAPPSTPFLCYEKKKAKKNGVTDQTKSSDGLIVVGETEAVEFVSNEAESKSAAQSGCCYLVSVFDRSTGNLTVYPVAKSPHILTRTVKRLKSIQAAPAPTPLTRKEARTALGETFGTKKAKAAIRAEERSHIDVGAMKGVMDYVMEGIEKGSSGLIAKEEAKEIADKSRLIPPYSTTATEPEDIYPLHDIIPDAEWKSLSAAIDALQEAQNERDRIALLPFRHSQWVNAHLNRVTRGSGKGKKRSLKLLFYISAMMMFHQDAQRQSIDKNKLTSKMTNVPELVIESLFRRFSEVARNSGKPQMTTKAKTSLLSHILALCLKVDNYAVDPTVLAHDLSISISSVGQLLRNLGCKMTTLNAQHLSRHGLPDSAAGTKRAILSAPVEFPKPRASKRR